MQHIDATFLNLNSSNDARNNFMENFESKFLRA